MAFTKEELERIMAALNEKVPKPELCPICGNEHWEVGANLVVLVLQESAQRLNVSGPFFPCIPVSCSNCGNTHLLNLITLGLRDLVEKKKNEEKKKKRKTGKTE